jgi:hypothetical protein
VGVVGVVDVPEALDESKRARFAATMVPAASLPEGVS